MALADVAKRKRLGSGRPPSGRLAAPQAEASPGRPGRSVSSARAGQSHLHESASWQHTLDKQAKSHCY